MPTLHARDSGGCCSCGTHFTFLFAHIHHYWNFWKLLLHDHVTPIKQHPIICQIFDNSNIIIFPYHLSFLTTSLPNFHQNSFFDLFTQTDVMQIGLRASLSYEKVASTRDTRLPAIISCLTGSPPPSFLRKVASIAFGPSFSLEWDLKNF